MVHILEFTIIKMVKKLNHAKTSSFCIDLWINLVSITQATSKEDTKVICENN
jgi:hypothetical protein